MSEGDAKVWGTVADVPDRDLHQRFAGDLFERTGFDLRGELFDHFSRAELTGASSVEVVDDHLDVTVWRSGEAAERVIQKR
ncbi:hypothetical protein CGZ93_05555 [Enemella dayhoffiae]|uniref:Uncharacterized protein n=1 Tax=Enemella dayhoffiae TaxID=2016507 RepID=A0A255H8P5_9ACTN|nr:hypothetical protein [Enemella dayhoffiae]OYO23969.1 hypothetical protein CGZ93_05555 [Enemella dayhoffiae]